MSYFSVDVEADGPCPGLYSMLSFGAVLIDSELQTTFYGKVKPISDSYIAEALAVSGHSRQQHEEFDDPEIVMKSFADWINSVNVRHRPMFLADNLAFDWQWINYYFHRYVGVNPFGHSGTRLNDLYAGIVKNVRRGSEVKKFRKTMHTHHPVDDARGNAEAFLLLKEKFNLLV